MESVVTHALVQAGSLVEDASKVILLNLIQLSRSLEQLMYAADIETFPKSDLVPKMHLFQKLMCAIQTLVPTEEPVQMGMEATPVTVKVGILVTNVNLVSNT